MHEELLQRHLELVLEANRTTNITRISSWEDGMLLHVRDSLLGLPELLEAPEGHYADLGSGAGYPGIPLAIESGRETLLVDSVRKKTSLLDSFIDELNLKNVHTYTGRIEDLAREQSHAFAVVTARALAQLSVLMELAAPLLQDGGYLICYKAQLTKEEASHAKALENTLGLQLLSDREAALENYTRKIVCFKKTGPEQIKLPRKTGFAHKRPL